MILTMLVGCQRPMFPGPAEGQGSWWSARGAGAGSFQRLPNGQVQYDSPQQTEQMANLSRQMNDMSQQLSRFDADNQGLHGQVATLQQKLDAANNYNYQLKQQLRDATVQLQQVQQNPGQLAQQNASGSGGVHQFAGSATIRANNSLMGKLQSLQNAGIKASMDGDVIRIELPSEQLFIPNTYQIQPGQLSQLQHLAATIKQQFPEQFIGVEAHWDRSQIQGASGSLQQLTATQSLAVMNALEQAGVPNQQMFTVGMGSSRLRYPNNAPQNRRVEIVIYPETTRANSF